MSRDITPTTPVIGAQYWIDQGASHTGITRDLEAAHDGGLRAIRLTLLRPLVEPSPGVMDFEPFDWVLAECERLGLRTWLTLSPESLPWHEGEPGLVQSAPVSFPSTDEQRTAVTGFLATCVDRYRDHPSLARWIVWNEPQWHGPNLGTRRDLASDRERAIWLSVLEEMYGDVEPLNREWLTGFGELAQVPHPSQVLSPGRHQEAFAAYGIPLAECRFRARCLADEVAWMADLIRSRDPHTPISLNMPGPFDNLAGTGFDLGRLAAAVDLPGASIHAPWHLGFVEPADHPAYIAAGVGLLRGLTPHGRADLTEFQGGNVTSGAPGAQDTTPATVTASAVAALASGAEAAITWALNARSSGFEAGDWAMLNDDRSPSPVLARTRQAYEALGALTDTIGPWSPAEPRALVLVDECSEAVELVRALTSRDEWGADAHRGIRAAGSLVVSAMRQGHPARLITSAALDEVADGSMVMVPRGLALPDGTLAALDRLLERGVGVVIDAETLRLDDHGRLRSADDFSRRHGYTVGRLSQPAKADRASETTVILRDGNPAGHSRGPVLTITRHDECWQTDPAWSVGLSASPLVQTRTTEPLTIVQGTLCALPSGGPMLVSELWRRGLGVADVTALDGGSIVLPVVGERGAAWVVVGEPTLTQTHLSLIPGTWRNLWTGSAVKVDGGSGVITLHDGIAMLVREE